MFTKIHKDVKINTKRMQMAMHVQMAYGRILWLEV